MIRLMKRAIIYFKIIIFYLFTLIVFALASGVTKNSTNPDLFSLGLAATLTFIIAYLFTYWDKTSLTKIGIQYNQKSITEFGIGILLSVLMVMTMTALLTYFTDVTFEKSRSFNYKLLTANIFLYFFVSCREELAFRTYLLWRLRDNLRAWLALSIVTLVFIGEHILTGTNLKMAIFGPGLGSILFGLAFLKTKNIVLPLGLHFGWNTAHWLMGYKNNTGLFHETVPLGFEQQAESNALIAYSITMILGIGIILLLFPQSQNSKKI